MLDASENGPRGTMVNVSMPPFQHRPLTFPLGRVIQFLAVTPAAEPLGDDGCAAGPSA